MSIFFGSLGVVLGALITLKSAWLYQNIGASAWAEQHLGSGGSSTFYKLVGVMVVVVSFLIMTGMMGNIIMWIFGPLFGINQ